MACALVVGHVVGEVSLQHELLRLRVQVVMEVVAQQQVDERGLALMVTTQHARTQSSVQEAAATRQTIKKPLQQRCFTQRNNNDNGGEQSTTHSPAHGVQSARQFHGASVVEIALGCEQVQRTSVDGAHLSHELVGAVHSLLYELLSPRCIYTSPVHSTALRLVSAVEQEQQHQQVKIYLHFRLQCTGRSCSHCYILCCVVSLWTHIHKPRTNLQQTPLNVARHKQFVTEMLTYEPQKFNQVVARRRDERKVELNSATQNVGVELSSKRYQPAEHSRHKSRLFITYCSLNKLDILLDI